MVKVSNITFILFSFNEEHRIEHVVRNLVPYGEVLILDGGSTDNTKEIAEKHGARFVVRPKIETAHVETQEMLDFAKSLVKTQWVLWSYVDNLLPKTLLEKLTELSNQGRYRYVYVPIYTYLWGEVKKPAITASYPNFFHINKMDFSKNYIHGLGIFQGSKDQILHLPNRLEFAIRHFSLYDVTKFVSGHMRYASSEAEDKFKNGKRFSLFYMLGSMGKYFFLFYKKSFKMGVKGLYIAMLYSFFRLMVAVRLYEIENNLTLETIETSFAAEKAKFVKEAEQV